MLHIASSLPSAFELSPIKAMELAASKIPGVISLAQGIPSFQTPESIKSYVRERLAQGLCDKYSLTIGLSELREEIALALQRDEGLRYDPDTEIVVTAGSIEGISAAVLSCTEPGDEVLIPSPSYVSYRGAIGLARCTPRYFELNEDDNFDFDIEQLARAITRRTKALLFCSPNNPTGTLFSEAMTRAVLRLAAEHDLTVIIDEVYKDFYYTSDKHFSACSIPEARSRVMRVCSFSKAYAMTGWRVGFLHADVALTRKTLKYHDAMVTCAPVISQYAAIAALRFGLPAFQEFKREFHRRRDYVIRRLDALSSALDYQLPKATYFVFPRIKDCVPFARDSTRLAYDILEKVHLALVPGVAFGPSGESHLRISYGREQEILDEGLNRLSDYLLSPRRQRKDRINPHQSEQHPPTLRRRLAGTVVGSFARAALWWHRPLIVGIVGAQGKTVFKRAILHLLSDRFRARGSILSYNTSIGMPLSILNLTLPRGREQFMRFPFALLRSVFTATSQVEILVLEYGVLTPQDAAELTGIAVPDWLVVTGTSLCDPNIDVTSLRDGVVALQAHVAPDRIIWNDLSSEPPPVFQGLRCSTLVTHDRMVKGAKASYSLAAEPVGVNADAGLRAAILLAEALGVSPDEIQNAVQRSAF